ncbi:MAG TPA: hypothetical protein VH165_24440 [Kofleriaceae bacterium]|jgi:hypothetical protein|nr:hypothetical protein [Kofleriaceae bacterium]
MTYRNDLAALAARKTALELEVRQRQRELDDANRMVQEIEARTKLPVLDNIRIAAPCSAQWANMVGDDRVRACGDCQKNVYNLSELTREDAEALIREKEGRLCARYYQRADGTILFKDCAVGVRRRRHRRFATAGVAASLIAAAFGYTRDRVFGPDDRMAHEQSFMGDIAISDPGSEAPPEPDHAPGDMQPVPPTATYEYLGGTIASPIGAEDAPVRRGR